MKKLFTLIVVFFSLFLFSQHKKDKIFLKDYTLIEGFVSKVADKYIEYTYPEEKTVNTIEKEKVAKIEFSSGRVQSFLENAAEINRESVDLSKNYKLKEILPNTIAVLPVVFVNTETLNTSAEMSKFAQNDMYSTLLEKSSNIFPLQVQDIRTTNALLKKAGIDYKNVDEVPVEDLQKILGTDHILAAKVSYIMQTDKSTVSSGNTDIRKNNKNVEIDDFAVTSSTEIKTFNYDVYFDLYKENKKIYSQTRQPFLRDKDSWKDSMRYLLKRAPIYSK